MARIYLEYHGITDSCNFALQRRREYLFATLSRGAPQPSLLGVGLAVHSATRSVVVAVGDSALEGQRQ